MIKKTVVIPIYKETPSSYERISLLQCLRVLAPNHPITIICPENLNLGNYQALGLDSDLIERFPEHFFKNIQGYNRLLLSPSFYKRLINFDYILIYQLDAFVFEDRFSEWCDLSFDYIGPIWPQGIALEPYRFKGARLIARWLKFWNQPQICFVGNGGFSLRKTQSCLNLVEDYWPQAKLWSGNEDYFFAIYGKYAKFKFPNNNLAIRFAFEQNPREQFEQNSLEIPFGCHAWEKWDIDFWRPMFSELGYEI